MVNRAKASMGSYSLITKWTFGNVSVSSATIGSSESRIPVAKPPTRTVAGWLGVRVEVEVCAVDPRQDRDDVLGEACPAGVSRTRRPSGSISRAPVSLARAAICCDTVDVVRW